MLRKKNLLLSAGVSLTALCVVGGLNPSHAQTYTDAPPAKLVAGRLDDALRLFAEQNGLQIIYLSKVTDNVRTAGAPSGMPPRQTLASLLKGTGLKFRFTDPNTVTIFSAQEKLAADPPSMTPDPPKADGLEEIVVTATKTGARSIQRTPIAVTAFSANQLNEALSSNIKDLAEFTPNVTVSQVYNNAAIYIRGVGTNNVYNGSDPDVTMQVDGVYISRPSAQFTDFLDVERVEVLRGPQGTLYGRNAAGGTLNIISRQPTDTFAAQNVTTVGNYGLVQDQAYISGPIVPGKLRASFSLNYIRHDDYEKNLTPNLPGVNSANHGGGRLQLRYDPTDDIDATTRIDYSAGLEDQESFDHLRVPYPNAPLASSIINNLSEVALNNHQRNAYHNGGISEDINIKLSDIFTLKSISAYRFENYNIYLDVFGTENYLDNGYQHENENQVSQEFNLNAKWNKIEAVAGLYYFSERTQSRIDAYYPPSVIKSVAAAQQLTPRALGHTQSVAGFSQGTYHVTPKLGVTLGLRYTEDDKNVSDIFSATHFAGPLLGTSLSPAFPFRAEETKHFYSMTPKFGIDWQMTDNMMSYFSATRGYKSGGFNFAATSLPALAFDSEKIWSYEIGAKTEWLDRRLRFNLTGFLYDYSDLQVQELIGPGLTGIGNAPAATVKGIEAEYMAKPLKNFILNGNLSYLDALYKNFPNASAAALYQPYMIAAGIPLNGSGSTATFNADGKYLSGAPTLSGTIGGKYDWILPSLGRIYLRSDLHWTGRTYYDPSNLLLSSQGAYFLVDAGVGFIPRDSNWQIQLWAKNLTNKLYFVSVATNSAEPAGALAAPRTFGVRLTLNW